MKKIYKIDRRLKYTVRISKIEVKGITDKDVHFKTGFSSRRKTNSFEYFGDKNEALARAFVLNDEIMESLRTAMAKCRKSEKKILLKEWDK